MLPSEIHTIRDAIRWTASEFNRQGLYFGHGTDNALDEAAYLVFHAIALPMDIPGSYYETVLSTEEKQRINEIICQRIEKRIPASYITNEAFFMGMPFYVNEHVLVPRSPIAELIEAHFQPWIEPGKVCNILDMCTGSGCIGIACAHIFNEAKVDLVDISEAALDVARENIHRHHMEHQVEAIQSDLFSHLEGRKYDIIVSNPPYVDAQDFNSMPKEYLAEPALGLEAGEDGLDIVIPMLAVADEFLRDGGIIVVEVGNSMWAMEELFKNVPFTWLEFEHGGQGVFLLTKHDLHQYKRAFRTALATRKNK